MGEADFWNNQEKAQATVAELKAVNSVLKPLEEARCGVRSSGGGG